MQRESNENQDEISLFEILLVMRRRWKLLVFLPAFVAVCAGIITMIIPNQYESVAKVVTFSRQVLLPIEAVRAEKGGVISGARNAALTQQNMPVVKDILESSPLQMALIRKFGLSADTSLSSLFKVKINKSGVVEIAVIDASPQQAAALANAAVQELGNRAYAVNLVRTAAITSEHDLDTLGPDDNVVFKLLQPATVPVHHVKPKRPMMVLLSTVSAFFVALVLSFVLEAMQKLSPDERRRWEQLM